MVKHNNVVPNGHFKKDWQSYVKTCLISYFDGLQCVKRRLWRFSLDQLQVHCAQ
jgi:hypothetical protein